MLVKRTYNSPAELYKAGEKMLIKSKDAKWSESETYFKMYTTEDHASFWGLTRKECEQAKYGYEKGVEKITHLPEFDIKGQGKFEYKWDEFDGDTMEMDRYYEGLSCMQKRLKRFGHKTGRFMDIVINLCESAYVDYNNMLWKTYAAIKIVDQYETANIRCKIKVCSYSLLNNKDKQDDLIEVTIKDYNDPMNIGLLANCISPWFFRRWMLMDIITKYHVELGVSFPKKLEDLGLKSIENCIVIDSGECLSKDDATAFIKNLNTHKQ